MQLKELEQLFAKPPNTQNISTVRNLKHFIQEYPDEQLWPNLYKLEQTYKYYRAINGDGNCFYRAIMFLYLREDDLGHFQTLFPFADLLNCKNLPFQITKNHQSQHILEFVWQTYLLPLSELSRSERQKQLQKIMNSSLVLDAILIAYFRVLNHNYLLKHRTQVQAFCDGGIQNDLKRILTYGKQSQGVQIFTLAKILSAKIEVLMVHRETFQHVCYNDQGQRKRSYVLFYRPGHYDILSENQKVQQIIPSSTATTFTQFYRQNIYPNRAQPYVPVNKSNLSSNSAKSSGSKVISISKLEEIKYIPFSRNANQSEKKPPVNMNDFKSKLGKKKVQEEKKEKNSSNSNKKSSVTQDSPKRQTVNIKSLNLEKKQEIKKQKIMVEATICIGVIVIILVGFFAL